MSKLQLRYKGSTISERDLPLTIGDTFVLETAGKYCEDDISAEVVSGLPSTYQAVEYLESTGIQRIILGNSVPTSKYKFYFKLSPTRLSGSSINGYNGIMGADSSPQVGFFEGGWTVGNVGSTIPYKPIVGRIYEIVYSKDFDGSYWVNGYDTTIKRTGNMNPILFCVESSTNNVFVKLYCASAISDTDEYLYNLIPCYRKSDSKPGMYDLVTDTFFTNQGTGEFIVGSDVN